MNRTLINVDTSILHHLFYITVVQGIGQVPAETSQNQLLLEMPAAKGYRRHVCKAAN
jgi:hypothetical protein